MLGGTFSSALLGSLLDDAIGVSAALSFPVVLAAIASLLMGLLAGTCLANSRIGSLPRAILGRAVGQAVSRRACLVERSPVLCWAVFWMMPLASVQR